MLLSKKDNIKHYPRITPDTNYGLVVKGIDKAGNQAVSDIQTVTTQTDTRPPQVSGMKVEGESCLQQVEQDKKVLHS